MSRATRASSIITFDGLRSRCEPGCARTRARPRPGRGRSERSMRPGRFSAERSSGEGATIGPPALEARHRAPPRKTTSPSRSPARRASRRARRARPARGPTALVSVASSCSGRKEASRPGAASPRYRALGRRKRAIRARGRAPSRGTRTHPRPRVVDPHDVRVVEPAQHLVLSSEPARRGRVRGGGRTEHLHGGLSWPVETCRPR